MKAVLQRPVLTAARKEWWLVCTQLLRSGCSTEPSDLRFALVRAAAAGQAQVVSSLIDAGACIVPQGAPAQDVTQAISLAFSEAARHGAVEVCRVMLEKQVVQEQSILHGALLSAAAAKDTRLSKPVLELLLQSRVDPTAGNPHFICYGTPLSHAIGNNNIEAAEMLLKHGARVRPTPGGSYSPLRHAVSFNTGPEMVRLLMEYGADEQREEAMKLACEQGRWDILQVLMVDTPTVVLQDG